MKKFLSALVLALVVAIGVQAGSMETVFAEDVLVSQANDGGRQIEIYLDTDSVSECGDTVSGNFTFIANGQVVEQFTASYYTDGEAFYSTNTGAQVSEDDSMLRAILTYL